MCHQGVVDPLLLPGHGLAQRGAGVVELFAVVALELVGVGRDELVDQRQQAGVLLRDRLGVDLWHARGIEVLAHLRSEEHTSELPSLMRNSYAVFCLKKKTKPHTT